MWELDYDFKKCFICESEMFSGNSFSDKKFFYCKNECCRYECLFLSKIVIVKLFNEGALYINLIKGSTLLEDNRIEDGKEILEELVNYWKENDRYLIRLMEVD